MYIAKVKIKDKDEMLIDVDDEQASIPNYSAQLCSWLESLGHVVESIRLEKTEEVDV